MKEARTKWDIRAERPEDAPLVDALNAESFGPGRFARSAFRLREGVAPERALSFIAVEAGTLRGSVRFWPIVVGAERALMLGPLAVQSDQRGRGIGIALMIRGLEEAKALGHRAVILVGDLPYYARAGFVGIKPGRIRFPGPVDPARILGVGLVKGALETLEGDIKRARIDAAVCADGAPLAH
jgi:predicted N-acetyltransferase YhbS